MKNFRIVLWAAIAVLGGFLAWSTLQQQFFEEGTGARLAGVQIGGPFEAVRTDGQTVTQEDLKGRPHVIFFGFTHCPDVCPTTLYEAGRWLKDLGPDGDKLDVYFVTVDPERDTRELMASYLTSFDSRISGITGTPEQIQTMLKAWRAFAQKDGDGDDYNVNHTATTYMMDANGEFFGTIGYGENHETAVAKLKRLLEAS
ncbi:SCO family protein [Pseudahrensia aquimaris]|uniref:SCO family protein n=1 Tax=Pseudahrensia aquimaris TaxID=744461 RepID=A0ABW3FFC2_9HYPH